MDSKQEALQWIKANNKFGPEAPFVSDFEGMIAKAIEQQDTKITTWIMGGGLSKDGFPYKLIWHPEYFTAHKISREEAGVEAMQLVTFEREIPNSAKIDESSHEDVTDEVWENLSKAWDSISIVEPETDGREPTSKKELDDFKMWVSKAKNVAHKNENDDALIDNTENLIAAWEKKHFDGVKRDLIVLLVLFGLMIAVNFIDLINGNFGGGEEGFNFVMFFLGVIWLAGAAGYYWANQTPRWLLDLRNAGPRNRISDYFARWAKKTFHTTVYNVTTYSDGTVERRPSLLSGPFASSVIWLIYYYLFLQFIPIWSGYAALKNHVLFKK